MFVAQAHSITQQARLAITLAWVAGYTNIITIITCGHVTSHVTGTASNLGRDVVEGSWPMVWFALYVLLTFFLGAASSALMTETGRRRGWDSIYVLPMAFEAMLLAFVAVGVEFWRTSPNELLPGVWALTGVASMAMGLQNATITRISSGVVRTTHLTGVLTDLGAETVLFIFWLRDRARNSPPDEFRELARSVMKHPTSLRLTMLASIIGSFSLGAALGSVAFDYVPKWCMFPPVAFLLWIIYQDVRTPICEIETSKLTHEDAGLGLPSEIAIFHLRKGEGRQHKAHRLPDLLRWCERLPDSKRIVILDLGAAELDSDAGTELAQIVRTSAAKGRRILISGMTGQQYNEMRRSGASAALDPSNVCPDLELAIARGLALLESDAET